MADMEERVELNYLLDFYGPLLTEHRQEVMRLYCEEDLSQQEIADQLSITRQGVFDALAKARRQLTGYEAKLGLVKRHRAQTEAARACLAALAGLHPAEAEAPALAKARQALEDIIARD
jgi:predicted DNA-binding protein YlxM (UPF0122 family)